MMRATVIKNELHKILHTGSFMFILVGALLLNVYMAASSDVGQSYEASYYKEYFETIDGMSDDEIVSYTEELADYSILSESGFSYEKYQRYQMARHLMEQYESVKGYKEYLESINETAKTMTSVSIFANKDSFSYRNIVITPAAYEAVEDVTPAFESSLGVILAVENTASDLLIIFIIIAAAGVVFYKDRENGTVALLRPLKLGRASLAASRTFVMFAVCLISQILIFGTNLAIGAYRFGLPHMSSPVQSLERYLSCNLPITVLEFLIFTLIVKLAAMFLISLIMQCLFIKLKSVYAYAGAIILAATEATLFLTISDTSAFSVFKQVNLLAFVSSNRLFVTYKNINFFGYPINLITTTAIALLVFIAIGIILTLILFSRISVSEIKKNTGKKKHLRVPKGLYSYTSYKTFVLHKGAIIIVAVLAFQRYTAYNCVKRYDATDSYYYSYCLGTEENHELMTVEEYIEITEESVSGAASLFSNQNYASQGLELFKTQYEYVKQLGYPESEEYRLMYYRTGYNEMFGVTSKGIENDYMLGLIAVCVICLVIAPLIAYDSRARIGYLLYTTKAGKSTYIRHNMISASVCAILTSLAVYIPYFYQVLSNYGTQGIFETVRAISGYPNMLNISVLGYKILLLVLRTLVLVILSQIVLFISSRFKSPTYSMIFCLAIFALPILISLAGADFIRSFCLPVSGNREMLKLVG